VEIGSIADVERRQKLEYLLRVKKWNPYCFRHSAITVDSDDLPDYALKKKVRWTMNSQQGKRYIKNKMGDELKNKILERHGIKIAAAPHMVSRPCGRCGYVNRLESKYCENFAKGCNYPLTQLAHDEIKAAEQSKFQVLHDEILLETKAVQQKKDQEIAELKEQVEEIRYLYQDLIQRNTVAYNLTKDGRWEISPNKTYPEGFQKA